MRRSLISLIGALALVLPLSPEAVPSTGSWSFTGSMAIARAQSFTLTLLPSGKVLAAGGLIGTTSSLATASAELYDPTTGYWTSTDDMTVARSRHTATLLLSGKVLVAGGQLINGVPTTSAELYEPATGHWRPAGSMSVPRANFTATLLQDGRVLVTGGVTDNGQPGAGNVVTKTAELYDPATNTWSRAAKMANQRYVHRASLLPDGRVLVTGGSGVTIHCMMRDTAEIYDPPTDVWASAPSMSVARSTHLAQTLPDGHVLVAGGWSLPVNSCGNDGLLETGTESSELFDGSTDTWRASGDLNDDRGAMPDAQLADGRVLVAGGRIEAPGDGTVRTAKAEIYDLAAGAWRPAASMNIARSGNVAVGLADGRALVAGGGSPLGPQATAETYTP